MLTAFTAWWIVMFIVALLVIVAPRAAAFAVWGSFWLTVALFGLLFFAVALAGVAAVDAFQFSRRLLARSEVR